MRLPPAVEEGGVGKALDTLLVRLWGCPSYWVLLGTTDVSPLGFEDARPRRVSTLVNSASLDNSSFTPVLGSDTDSAENPPGDRDVAEILVSGLLCEVPQVSADCCD